MAPQHLLSRPSVRCTRLFTANTTLHPHRSSGLFSHSICFRLIEPCSGRGCRQPPVLSRQCRSEPTSGQGVWVPGWPSAVKILQSGSPAKRENQRQQNNIRPGCVTAGVVQRREDPVEQTPGDGNNA